MREQPFQRRLIQIAVASCFASAVHANPLGPTVMSGAATFNAVGKNLTVTNAPGTIINWQGFSIRADEVTRFVQSGAASAVLNRVTGTEHSQLLGQLLSNGKVFLINPNGVTVGAGALIDTAGFVASSLNLSNDDFLAGKFRFTDPGNAGKVVNAGTVNAHAGGPVYLVAPTVENHGVITSPGGDVLLAAGKSVELVSAASPHLRVQVQAGGEALNVGRLVAESGRVGLYGAAVRNSGTVNADSAQLTAAGTVVLKASKDVTLDATSTISANGARGGSVTVHAEAGTLLADGKIEARGSQSTGGEVKLLGERVGLMNQAVVDASGASGGGTILAGGDFQGRNPDVQNARVTYVAPDARLVADSTGPGDGGRVIVWADGTTRYAGSIAARGGDGGGNGGFAEVSGKETLEFTGSADLRAAQGAAGTLLLDPKFIVIQAGGTAPVATNDQFAENATGISVISGANLGTAINGGNITLQANTDITFDDNVTATTANRNLTLQAGRSIIFNASRVVTLNDSQFTATINDVAAQAANRDAGAAQFLMNSGSQIVTQGKTAGARGNVAINVGNFGGSSAGSQVTMLGGATINASGSANRAAGLVTIAGTTATAVDTSGGTITANGGANGAAAAGRAGGAVAVTGGSVTTGAISTRGSDGVGGNNVGGTGGAVTLTANAVGGALQANGAIDTRGGNSVGTGNTGAGGAVILRTANNGTIASTAGGTIATTGGRGQTGGNVIVTSVTPATDTVATVNLAGAINVDGGVTAASGTLGGKNAGAVSITNANSIIIGAISARGSTSGGGNNAGGSGGAVNIDARNANPSIALTGTVDTRGGDGTGTGNTGNGGSVQLRTANGGSVTSTAAATVTTTGGRGQTGGNFTVTTLTPATDTLNTVNLAGAINVDGGVTAASGTLGGKNAGAVSMVNVNAVTVGAISARGSSSGGGNNAGGNGGAVTIDARNATPSIALAGAIDTRGGDGTGTANTGNGGLVRLRTAAGGSVTGTAAATIDTTGGRGQTGGTVTVSGLVAADTLASANLAGAITTSGGLTAASGTLAGKNAGAVSIGNATTITVGSITARGTNAGAAVGNNNVGGSGGAVTVNRLGAASTVTLNDTIDTRGGDSAGTGNTGAGGAVVIDGGTAPALGNLTVAGGANIDARGGRGQTGGTVTIRDFTTIAMSGTSIDTSAGAASANGAGVLGQGKNAGVVSITSTGASSVGAITAQGSAAVAGSGKVGGNGANAAVTGVGVTLNGAISTRGGDSDGTGAGGSSGAVTVNGGASGVTGLAPATITTTGGRGQTGGAVTVNSAVAGAVNLAGAITTTGGGAPTNAAGRAGGNVSVTGGSVTVGGIDTSGSAASGAGVLAGGAAGTLALDATAGGGTITLNGNLTARGGAGTGGGAGGVGRNITFGDATRLNADVVIDALAGAGGAPAGGNVNFQSTLDSATATARNLTVNTNGTTTFGGAVGATNALASVTTDGPGTTAINGGSIRTTGAQTYNDNVTLGAATTLTTTANGDVTANGRVLAGANALTASAGAGNVTMLNAANNFATVSVASASGVSLRDTNAIDLGASTIAGSLALTANGAVTDSGALSLAGTTTIGAGAANNITLDNANDFGGAVTVSSGNAVRLNDVNALTLAASSFGTLAATAGGALNVDGALTASGAGNSIVLSGTSLQNNVGAGALTVPGGGRWIVYSANPAGNTFNGLASGNQAVWNATFAGNPPATIPGRQPLRLHDAAHAHVHLDRPREDLRPGRDRRRLRRVRRQRFRERRPLRQRLRAGHRRQRGVGDAGRHVARLAGERGGRRVAVRHQREHRGRHQPDRLCDRGELGGSADRQPGGADGHGRQPVEDLRPDDYLQRHGVRLGGPAERRDDRFGHARERGRPGERQRRRQPVRDHRVERHRRDVQPRELHDHVQQWRADGEPGGARRDGEQPDQDLRPGVRLHRHRVQLRRAAERRDDRFGDPRQRRCPVHRERRRQPLRDYRVERRRRHV